MPIPILRDVFDRGVGSIPYVTSLVKLLPIVLVIAGLKFYFKGASNRSERLMHSKVVMGGTSGIGASVVRELASRGAQIILLTRHAPNDPFLVDYIEDLRATTDNDLIYAEQVDLSSLHSIRLFATKWVDNAPPRRLDMIILCANTMTPAWGFNRGGAKTVDGLEEEWGVNYLANFHLLSILSPAIRAQPADRDVRVLFSTCSSYIGATLDLRDTDTANWAGGKGYGRSKLALMVFASAFQKHLDAYKRPDSQPTNARTVIVDPGFCRTPGTRRWLSGGSLWGLLLYLLTWPLWWLILKPAEQGAQPFLLAAMEATLGVGVGGRMIKECREISYLRNEVTDEKVAKGLWEFSEKQIEELEKRGAVKRALEKKEKEEQEKKDSAATATATTNNSTNTSSTSPVQPDSEATEAQARGTSDSQEAKSGSRRSRRGKKGAAQTS